MPTKNTTDSVFALRMLTEVQRRWVTCWARLWDGRGLRGWGVSSSEGQHVREFGRVRRRHLRLDLPGGTPRGDSWMSVVVTSTLNITLTRVTDIHRGRDATLTLRLEDTEAGAPTNTPRHVRAWSIKDNQLYLDPCFSRETLKQRFYSNMLPDVTR